jgi:hypothetical protein
VETNKQQFAKTIHDLSERYWLVMGFPSQSVCEFALAGEVEIWKTWWLRLRKSNKCTGRIPETVEETLEKQNWNADIFPNISALLQILITLPISVASVERSFSTSRRLKTRLRTKVTGERLAGLALLHVHRDIVISVESVSLLIDLLIVKIRSKNFLI